MGSFADGLHPRPKAEEHPSKGWWTDVKIDEPVMGERVAAVVVLRPDTELTLDKLVAFPRERQIASFKLPERLRFVDLLPRNPVGVVLKRELRLGSNEVPVVSGSRTDGV